MKQYYLGIDMGSVSTNLVLMNPDKTIAHKVYIRSQGRPVESLKEGMEKLKKEAGEFEVLGAGVTGSGRKLIGALIGADVVKNEITAHAIAAAIEEPGVRTILEIGGQDSKLIWLQDGIVQDFAMNTVCAAGTGSFLDRQAGRLGIAIEELGPMAQTSQNPVRIAGRCAVFAESDMIHKQQEGCPLADILRGLCQALARNFLSNLAKGRTLQGPILFQGGVAASPAMVDAFQEELQAQIRVPRYFDVMGAWGAAILAMEEMESRKRPSSFKMELDKIVGPVLTFECSDCSNRCQIVRSGEMVWGSRCGKY